MSPLALALFQLGSVAEAADPNCPELYVAQFEQFLDQVDAEFTKAKYDHARILLDAGYPRVPCIVQIVPTQDLAAFAIRRAFAYAIDLDQNETERWANVARGLDPSVQWPPYVPQDHAIRKLFDELPPVEPTALEGGLVVPPGGGVFLDGRFVVAPVATPELPHLLQVGDGTGRLTLSQWQDGALFPKPLLGPALAVVPEEPRWFTHPGAKIRPPRDPHPWTEARRSRLESAAGFAVAGGTLFATALVARQAYDERSTNGLFYTVDGATLASGAAGGTALVLLSFALFGK